MHRHAVTKQWMGVHDMAVAGAVRITVIFALSTYVSTCALTRPPALIVIDNLMHYNYDRVPLTCIMSVTSGNSQKDTTASDAWSKEKQIYKSTTQLSKRVEPL